MISRSSDDSPDIFSLITFGSVELQHPEGDALNRQPKRLALLVHIVTAPDGRRSRDALQAMFWPDSDARRARQALNQALHQLRRQLGDRLRSSGPDEVFADRQRIWCDAVAFEEAIQQGRLADALELFRGDFLPGFHVDDAAGFEWWLESERIRYRAAATRAASNLAEREADAGRAREAGFWARRAVALAGRASDEATLRRSIELLARIGDSAGAMQLYEQFAGELMQEFESEPSAPTRELIATVRRAAQPRAEVDSASSERAGGAAGAAPGASAAGAAGGGAAGAAGAAGAVAAAGAGGGALARPAGTGESRAFGGSVAAGRRAGFDAGSGGGAGNGRSPMPRRSRSLAWLAAVGVLATLAVVVLTQQLGRKTAEAAVVEPRVTVRVFEGLGSDPEVQEIARGISRELVGQLARAEGLQVLAEPAGGAGERLQEHQGVDLFVRGSVMRSQGTLRVVANLVERDSRRTLHSLQVERPDGRIFEIIEAVSSELAQGVRQHVGLQVEMRRFRAGTDSASVWLLVQRARSLYDQHADLLMRGLPDLARGRLEAADSLLARAEMEDPVWIEPTVQRAITATAQAFYWRFHSGNDARADLNLQHAIEHAERALQREPENPAALAARATSRHMLYAMLPAAATEKQFRLLAADRDLRAAAAADPDNAAVLDALSGLQMVTGAMNEANMTAEQAYRVDTYMQRTHSLLPRLFQTSFELGDDEAAVGWCEELNEVFPTSVQAAECMLVALAWLREPDADEAWEVLERTSTPGAMNSIQRPVLEMRVAGVLARAGLADSARAVAARAKAHAGADPKMLELEAALRVLLGEDAAAADLLERFIARDRIGRQYVLQSRTFARIRELVDATPLRGDQY